MLAQPCPFVLDVVHVTLVDRIYIKFLKKCQIIISDKDRCFCNGHVNETGGGECKTDNEGSPWCYVNKNSSCADKKKSASGLPFQWSSNACMRMYRELP